MSDTIQDSFEHNNPKQRSLTSSSNSPMSRKSKPICPVLPLLERQEWKKVTSYKPGSTIERYKSSLEKVGHFTLIALSACKGSLNLIAPVSPLSLLIVIKRIRFADEW